MADLITVKAAKEDGRVVLYEQHPDHPGGEAWVSGNGREVKVSHTYMVGRKLRTGDLVRVDAAPAEPLAGYDTLTVAEIHAVLATLPEERRAEILAYEAEHKARKGILEA